jgi:hypothetical protein
MHLCLVKVKIWNDYANNDPSKLFKEGKKVKFSRVMAMKFYKIKSWHRRSKLYTKILYSII